MRDAFDFEELRERLTDHTDWLELLDGISKGFADHKLHLAVFTEPYLSHLLSGKKTIESRFSRVRCAPFRDVAKDDVILIKASGGPVRAITRAIDAAYFHFGNDCFETVREAYGHGICADDEFWEQKKAATYATIITLSDTVEIRPLAVPKRDRRGWVPLFSNQQSFTF